MTFEWDDAKNAASIAERGIDFVCVHQFDFASAFIESDTRCDYCEDRVRALGLIKGTRRQLAFTLRNGNIRVISLRRANARERRRYDRETAAKPGNA
ncbi:BrnT family toxin [Sagittula sp. S175]|uniref:BrnT family toxin n=1 Tax=Sagittula sp. S175 TaxID=3415129 RepID=UPI003C7B0A72